MVWVKLVGDITLLLGRLVALLPALHISKARAKRCFARELRSLGIPSHDAEKMIGAYMGIISLDPRFYVRVARSSS